MILMSAGSKVSPAFCVNVILSRMVVSFAIRATACVRSTTYEVLTLFRRVHIPYFVQARGCFSRFTRVAQATLSPLLFIHSRAILRPHAWIQGLGIRQVGKADSPPTLRRHSTDPHFPKGITGRGGAKPD